MTPTLLQTVLRRATRLADDPTAPGASDAELLRRFADGRDEPAFQTILDRHGPLAWAVCRQMLPNPADAEDAFQATFLALVQSANKLGRVKSVGGWLHGVAVKVCLKVRRTAVRRQQRETKSAKPEGVADAVPQWDDLHAAVHEEVERLPATLRTVFVLCELEGVRQPDAAAKLGCKLGTVSGRLTRARQALLKSLTARGLAPVLAVGTVAVGSSAAAVPSVLVEKALSMARGGIDAGLVVPSSVFQLAKSATEGAFMKTKLMVAAGLVAAGLMMTAAGRWVPTADAQDPPPIREAVRPAPQPDPRATPRPQPLPPRADPRDPDDRPPPRPTRQPVVDPTDPLGGPQPPRPPLPPQPPRPAQPPRFEERPVPPGPGEPAPPPMSRGPQQRVEHEVFDVPESKDELVKLLRKQEAAGWEFAGQANAGKVAQLVFKRPKGNPGGWAPQPGAGIPRQPGEPGQPMRNPVPQPPRFEPDPNFVPQPRPRDPLPRRGDELPPAREPQPRGRDELPPAREPLPRRGGDRLPPAEAPIPPARNRDIPPPETDLVPVAVPSVNLPPAGVAPVGEIHVIQMKNATPAAMKTHISRFFDVDVSVDEDTGSLVIRCEKKTLEEIKKLVEQLDKPARGGA